MRNCIALLFIVFAFIARDAAVAADSDHLFALRGAGALPCHVLTDAEPRQRPALAAAVETFSLGYISAMNRALPDVFDVLPLDRPALLANWIGAVCQSNRDQSIEQVLFSILDRVRVLRLSQSSPLLTLKAQGGTVTIRKATLEAVQQALIQKGLMKGHADGAFNKATQAAVKAYQVSVFQTSTGLPDPQTVVRLIVADGGAGPTEAARPWWRFW